MLDYRSEEWVSLKKRFITEVWGEEIPRYLYLHLGSRTSLTQEELGLLSRLFFPDHPPGWGDIELHWSDALTSGSYLVPTPRVEPFLVARIRGARAVHYMVDTPTEEPLHLIQAGASDEKLCINFLEQWGPSPLDTQTQELPDPSPEEVNMISSEHELTNLPPPTNESGSDGFMWFAHG